ncbi:hypothetical protein [Solidesulfovibrio sp.]|uniref:hypothetical protein n=1 Tax=Solidesulfovibrio sp. TaxID=2910990 RepID=UPI002B1F68E8|nr:hypothetical protein [Solidesulfovibrio sp.]MEA4857896.1 hypothetical protein [Solidesulfovibrio sp.]
MGAKDVLAAYAKSKTQYGGTGLYLLSLWNIIASGGSHSFKFTMDETVVFSTVLNMSGLLAALATALYSLLLYGRGTAKGPLVAAALRQAADCLEPKPEAQAPEQGAKS